ncbi:MAG: OmpA family protein, partial [Rhodospirillales bacterium]|nr:OmpA family protein [Rhodospirillales bacterium]
NGILVAPQALEERKIASADIRAEIAKERERLMTALGTEAPKMAPDACALSQTWLEHWMEQAEEGHQPDHIAAARDGYMKAIPDCVGKPMAPMALPGPFTIYFDFNSADVNEAGMKIVADIVAAVKGYKPPMMTISGNTDTVGSNDYNDRLARMRAANVRQAVMGGGGNAPMSISAYGEDKPAVKTPDNTREGKNRRVEVTFSPH